MGSKCRFFLANLLPVKTELLLTVYSAVNLVLSDVECFGDAKLLTHNCRASFLSFSSETIISQYRTFCRKSSYQPKEASHLDDESFWLYQIRRHLFLKC